MRTLLIGIVAIALLAIPVVLLATEPEPLDKETMGVKITVTAYGAIEGLPGVDSLCFTVPGPYDLGKDDENIGEALYGAKCLFNVLCNTNATLSVTCADTTRGTAPPGEDDFWPTARIAGHADEGLGFSISVQNIKSRAGGWDPIENGAWNKLEYPNGKAEVPFSIANGTIPVMTANLPNAGIWAHSYMDSARNGLALARVGEYTATLIVTLSPGV